MTQVHPLLPSREQEFVRLYDGPPRTTLSGELWGTGMTQNVVWYVIKYCAKCAGIEKLASHDLRRSCARLCHTAGGEIEQIQFLLGHASVQTTERYIARG